MVAPRLFIARNIHMQGIALLALNKHSVMRTRIGMSHNQSFAEAGTTHYVPMADSWIFGGESKSMEWCDKYQMPH
uniref:DUF4338 domain-containing protein n=1 Tax=Heterorhabditis bacteriophora TaxID=37862 RepID=A0A1I7X2A7_HETBA